MIGNERTNYRNTCIIFCVRFEVRGINIRRPVLREYPGKSSKGIGIKQAVCVDYLKIRQA